MKPLSRSLFIKQAILTFTLAVLLSLLSSCIQTLDGISREKKQINRFFHQTMDVVQQPMAQAAFRLDKSFAQQQVDSLVNNPNITRVQVEDSEGKVFVYGQEKVSHYVTSKHIADLLFPQVTSYQRKLKQADPNFVVGKLIIWPEKRAFADEFLLNHLSILLYNLVKDLVFASILSLFFYFLITHPLSSLSRLFSTIENDLEAPFPDALSKRYKLAEFGRLFASFSRLLHKLKYTMKELERSDAHSMAVIEHAADAVFLLDKTLKIVFLNSAAHTMLGNRAAALLGEPASQLLNKETFQTLSEHIDTTPADTPLIIETHLSNGVDKPVPVEINLAPFRVQGELEILLLARDISERLDAQEHIHKLAYYDTLTGLPNRQLLIERINEHFKQEEIGAQNGALIMIDLDRFNTINDALGHNVGDKLLMRMAEELSLLEREGIELSRIGGDEFAFLLTAFGDYSKVEGFVHAFSQQLLVLCSTFQEIEQYSMHISASIGAVVFSKESLDAATIIKQADTALHRAKDSGRNTYVMYEATMQALSDSRLRKEKALHRAVEQGAFELYYQPQIDNLGGVIGAEVLIRWYDEEYGFIPPNEFIPLAEEIGLIVDIGTWVMDSALSQVSKWLEDGLWLPNWRVSINVSPMQFQQYDFLEILQETIAKYQVPTSCIDLEITENMLLSDLASSLEKMHEIQGLGIHLSVDDFGTGYSSLKYLKVLPINRLKIDQSFVRDLLADNGDEAIVYAIVALAKAFNVSVLAEGVETVEQFERLQDIGCYYYQGYLFSRPVPSSQFIHECVHGLKV